MAEIVLDHVNKSYPDGHTAVRDLQYSPSPTAGGARTTTLNMIAGLEDISTAHRQ